MEDPSDDMRRVHRVYKMAAKMDSNVRELVFIQLGFTDLRAPTITILDRVLYWVKRAMEESEPIVIRCGGGQGRTGSVLAMLISVQTGLPIDRVLNEGGLADAYDEGAAAEVRSLNEHGQYVHAWQRWLTNSAIIKHGAEAFAAKMAGIRGDDPDSPRTQKHGVWTFHPNGDISKGVRP